MRPACFTAKAHRHGEISGRPHRLAIWLSGRGRRSADLGSLRFGPLRGTAAEARSLEPLLAGAEVRTGAGATEGWLKQLHAPRILHIATHGFFLNDEPEALQASREFGQETQRV